MNTLRRLLALGLLVCVVTASARSDERGPDNAKLLIGTWEVTKANRELPVGAVMEFAADGKMKMTTKKDVEV